MLRIGDGRPWRASGDARLLIIGALNHDPTT
jgi:hypothetical protein